MTNTRTPPGLAFGIRRTPEEFAEFVMICAQINPRGFRQPSTKPNKWKSTSLVERAAIRAGLIQPQRFERSPRGQRKLEADAAMKRAIAAERINGIDPKYLSSHARAAWHSPA